MKQLYRALFVVLLLSTAAMGQGQPQSFTPNLRLIRPFDPFLSENLDKIDKAVGTLQSTVGTGTGCVPSVSSTAIQKGDGSGGCSNAAQGTDYYAPAGTKVAIADGGTNAATAAAARTNLGLVIDTDVEPKWVTTVVASLGTATNNRKKWVTDANPDCGTGGGTTVRLCRGNGTTWDTVGDGGSSELTPPGGSTTQLQRNSSSAFGGISGATSDGTNVTFGSANLRSTRPRITTSLDDSGGNQIVVLPGDGTGKWGSGYTVGFDTSGLNADRDVKIPDAASNTIIGIADPADSSFVKYTTVGGVQVRGVPAGASISGGTTGTIPKYASSSSIGDSVIIDCGSSLVAIGTCAGASTGLAKLGQANFTIKAAPTTPSSGIGAVYVDLTTLRLSDKDSAGAIGQTVIGIANPSDSQFVKYVNQSGVQVRGVPAGGGGGSAAQVTRLRHDSTQTLVNGTVLNVAFNAEQFDDAGWHSDSTNNPRITFDAAQACTLTGNAQITLAGAGSAYLFFRFNGSTETLSQSNFTLGAGAVSIAVSTIYKFVATDYVELRALTIGTGGTIAANEIVLSALCSAI